MARNRSLNRLWTRSRWLRPIATGTAMIMSAGLLLGVQTAAAAAWQPPTPEEVVTVPVRPVKPGTVANTWTPAGREVRGAPVVHWPTADSASVSKLARLSGAGAASRSVRVLDRDETRRTGVDGVVLQLAAAPGAQTAQATEVTVDYRPFAAAYGGDWASRLRLVALPEHCTAKADGCVTTPLSTRNDLGAGTASAWVPAGVSVVALLAAASGENGSYKATSLSPSSTWQVSRQTGDFGWTYAVPVPPAVGGPAPELALAYSAASVDGRTAATNTQGSWVGDGWEMWPGYMERKYRSCNDDKDGTPNNENLTNGEQCWYADNASMSLNGGAVELIRGTDGQWRGTSDSGARIELLKDTGLNNGDNDGEYWRVTTIDGTQYFFGRNRRPGWMTGNEETNSTWTAPVYGNHAGDPCHASDFAASRCTQAWRWNLDYVIDPHGNTMSYIYTKETGAYGRENDPAKRTEYTRGGYLARVDYGTRSDSEFTAAAPARVHFDTADRCAPNTACAPSVPASWPDTPWDQYCAAAPCTGKIAPTFWSQKRLAKIRTEVRDGAAWKPVDSFTLRQEFLSSGEREGKPMWLRGLTRTGHVGGDVSHPEIVFDPGADPLPNRVDGPADNRTALNRWRMKTITTETGSQISITYSGHDCTRSSLPTPHTNTKRCMPTWWAPDGLDPTLDWFHKYVVTRIDVWDATGASGQEQTNYDYLDSPAWHYDDGELTEAKHRTWNVWRGYGKVRIRTGLESGQQSASEYLYFRGMDGDKQPSGTRSVSITDSQGTTLPDHEALSGQVREEIIYDGPGGAVVSGAINDYWKRGPLATRGSLKAYMVNTSQTRDRVTLSSGVRWSKRVTTFNDENQPVQVDDFGDESTASDDQCTRTEYARNTTTWILDRARRVETVGVGCAATPSRPADVISDQRMYYDNADTFGAGPTRGLLVRTEEAGSWSGSTPSYVTMNRSTHDARGRVTSTSDALGRTTTTTFTPATQGPVTAITSRNPMGHTTTLSLEPAWDLAKYTTDANGARTEMRYDGLGRMTAVWLPGRDRATQTPNLEYTYQIRNNAPSAITARTLLPTGNSYRTAVALYDGQFRDRQTQLQATGGGRVINSIEYDSRGLVVRQSANFFTDGSPSDSLVTPTGQVQVPTVNEYRYDGVDRRVRETFFANGVEKWRTTIAYGGDRTMVTPPAGGTATTTITDARGRTTELRQHHGPAATGGYDATVYTYDDDGRLATVTDPANNVWRYRYDARGRLIETVDPDKGTSTATFDAAGQQVTTTDARGVTLATTYDALGRPTSTRDGSATGAKRAEWIYDTLPNGIGKQTASIRYASGGRIYRSEVTGYDAAGRTLGEKLTVPASDGFGQTEFTHSTSFKPDGSPATRTLPTVGDLAQERLTFNYNDVGTPTTYVSPLGIYVYSVTRNKLGALTQRVLGNFGSRTAVTYTIDEPTGRLTEAVTTPETKPEAAHYGYSYDDAGNLVRVGDAPAGGQADVQCYRYDHLQRLTTAWTPAGGDCAPNPSAAALGGPAPYYRTWAYDRTGNRLSETVHTTGGAAAKNYTHPAAGSPRPHTVLSTSTGDTYAYDVNGNMTTRNRSGSPGQALTWDAEGELASVTEAGRTTEYTYGADGQRLIRKDANGTTLYLPGGSELFKPASGGAAVGIRFYTHDGVTIAMRRAGNLTWIVGDHHNTAETQIANAGQNVLRRRTLPFGETRGAAPSGWAGDRGFVDGTVDATGLVHLGAREFDPALGRFVSVDPVIDTNDPQTMHGYAYANNSPTSHSDPDGRCYGREEGDLCPGHTRGPWAGTPAGDVARDKHFAGDRARAAARQNPMWTSSPYYNYNPAAQAAQWAAYEEAKQKHQAEQAARKAKQCSGFWNCAAKKYDSAKAFVKKWKIQEILDTVVVVGTVAAFFCPALAPVVLGLSIASMALAASTGDVVGVVLSAPGVGIALKAGKMAKIAKEATDKADDAAAVRKAWKGEDGKRAPISRARSKAARKQANAANAASEKWRKRDYAMAGVGMAGYAYAVPGAMTFGYNPPSIDYTPGTK